MDRSHQHSKNGVGLIAGTARRNITPPVGAPLLGTIQRCTGIHDELYARALVLGDESQLVAFISLDLIGMDFGLADEIREAIRKSAGISMSLVHCTHNHSAPFTIPWSVLGPRWLAGPGRKWRDSLPQIVAEAVAEAKRTAMPTKLSAGRAPVQIGSNRRLRTSEGVVMKPNPDGSVIPWVDVLRIERIDGTKTVLFSHAAHPVIIHGSSRLISAEFPGFAAGKLESVLGEGSIALFGQGFAGDINGNPLRGGIDAAKSAGEELARATLAALEDCEPITESSFQIRSVRIDIPLQALPSRSECEKSLKEAEEKLAQCNQADLASDERLWDLQDLVGVAKSQEESSEADDVQPMEKQPWWRMDTVLCLQDLLLKVDARAETPLRFEAHVLRIGDDWGLLATTHELFSEYQLRLEENVPTKHKMMLAYTNGCESYIPMDKDLSLGGYEASSFPEDGAALRYRHRRAVRPGCEQKVMEALRAVWK
ncbi:MAG TPA: neutral/alkaline non-lysosomal ceramidase N-terminal domain-containing protein [Terriglobales bacterium]|nr:neutral/alkaline non-lysosomal ceramidase N-terminal domain-containing protein [Terriglobales bacterium]